MNLILLYLVLYPPMNSILPSFGFHLLGVPNRHSHPIQRPTNTNRLAYTRYDPLNLNHKYCQTAVSINSSSRLFGGIGIAKTYSWKEEQFLIEMKVQVPYETKAKDILFQVKPKSIDLSVRVQVENSTNVRMVPYVNGTREMRGRINPDGTYWSFSEERNVDPQERVLHTNRNVTITIEKWMASSSTQDQFDIVEYDWGGIYPNDEHEILWKKYDEPEVLDVRKYAASLGVDIDNIDMSKVDKTMFTTGLNMSQSTLNAFTKMGYVQEVTRQEDGSESIMDPKTGEYVPFHSLGKDIGTDEKETTNIPFSNDDDNDDTTATFPFVRKPIMTEGTQTDGYARNQDVVGDENHSGRKNGDAIDSLTMARLKEILSKENLSIDGTGKEMRERLRNHIQSKLSSKRERTNNKDG